MENKFYLDRMSSKVCSSLQRDYFYNQLHCTSCQDWGIPHSYQSAPRQVPESVAWGTVTYLLVDPQVATCLYS